MLLYYRKVMKVLAEERQQMILQMLKENKVVKLQEICGIIRQKGLPAA